MACIFLILLFICLNNVKHCFRMETDSILLMLAKLKRSLNQTNNLKRKFIHVSFICNERRINSAQQVFIIANFQCCEKMKKEFGLMGANVFDFFAFNEATISKFCTCLFCFGRFDVENLRVSNRRSGSLPPLQHVAIFCIYILNAIFLMYNPNII